MSSITRALRQEIMNRAIIKQSMHGRKSGRTSHHTARQHKKSSHSRHHHA